jgi:DNA-binding SARP family transcriptional activator
MGEISEPGVAAVRRGRRAVEIRTLRGFSVTVDGMPLTFSRKTPNRPLGILKAIIAMGPSATPEQRLEDALWPDSEADAAHQAFNMALHRLRMLLGRHDIVLVRERRVSLNPRLCWVDVEDFERLAAAATLTAEGADDHVRSLSEAFTLYGGEFLAGEDETPCCIATRERLRDKFVRLVVYHIERLEANERWKDVLRFSHQAIEVEACAEVFHQSVMRAALHLDRKAEGIAVYDRLRRTLPLFAGMAPSPYTEQLYRLLRG